MEKTRKNVFSYVIYSILCLCNSCSCPLHLMPVGAGMRGGVAECHGVEEPAKTAAA